MFRIKLLLVTSCQASAKWGSLAADPSLLGFGRLCCSGLAFGLLAVSATTASSLTTSVLIVLLLGLILEPRSFVIGFGLCWLEGLWLGPKKQIISGIRQSLGLLDPFLKRRTTKELSMRRREFIEFPSNPKIKIPPNEFPASPCNLQHGRRNTQNTLSKKVPLTLTTTFLS